MKIFSTTNVMTRGGSYSSLKISNFLVRQRIGFGNDRDQIDFCVKSPHELDVNLLQPGQSVR
jgi:hypothetical protein